MLTKSTIDITDSNLFDILGVQTNLLVDKKDNDLMILIDDVVHVFNKKEDFDKFRAESDKYEPGVLRQATLGFVMLDVLEQGLNGISLHGYFPVEDDVKGIFVSMEDLDKKKGIINIATCLMSCAMGEITNELAIYTLLPREFYYLKTKEGKVFQIEKLADETMKNAMALFITETSAKEAIEKIGKEYIVFHQSLQEIVNEYRESENGFGIDAFGFINMYIDGASVKHEMERYHYSDTNATESDKKYIKNTNCWYIVLDAISRNKKNVNPFVKKTVHGNAIYLFERLDDALRYVYETKARILEDKLPIGSIKAEDIPSLAKKASAIGISHFIFNNNTMQKIEMEVNDIINEAVLEYKQSVDIQIIYKENETERKKNEKFIRYIVDAASIYNPMTAIINLAFECTLPDIIYALQYVEKLEEDDMQSRSELKQQLYTILLHRLNDVGNVYLVCNQKNDPIKNSKGKANIFIGRQDLYANANLCPIKISENMLNELNNISKDIIIQTSEGYKITVNIAKLIKCLKEDTEKHKANKLKFYLYFAYNTNLSMLGLDLMYTASCMNKNLFNEIIYAIDKNETKKSPEKIENVTINMFNEENIALSYIRFIEHICDAIPNPN